MKESITPYQIRLHLLEVAERILQQNKQWEAEEANWKASNLVEDRRKCGSDAHDLSIKLPRTTVQELVETAAVLKDFVDGAPPQRPELPKQRPPKKPVITDFDGKPYQSRKSLRSSKPVLSFAADMPIL